MGGDDLTMHDEVISSGEVLYFGVKKRRENWVSYRRRSM